MLTESPGMTRAPATQERTRFTLSFRILLILFALETLAINFARLPESMRFDRFAFCDHGANLTLQSLIAGGLRPSLDFAYPYGLLPALIGRIWFGIFGATPWAYQLAMVLADLLCAWAMAKILSQLKIGAVGLALAGITLGYAFQATYVNFAHAIEAVLLAHALAEQARGSSSNALALASAAVFAKPTMAYAYGLLLIVLIARDGFSLRRLVRAFAPAAIVFASLSTVLALTYGPWTLARTVLPLDGAGSYRALNFGLLGAARDLWDPQGQPWIFYFIGVSGFWIIAGIFLCIVALSQLTSTESSPPTIRHRELIVTCAILHIVFLTLFFGNQWSWIYYSYLLIVGIAIAVDSAPRPRRFGVAICAIALFSYTGLAYWTYRWWRTTTPDSTTAGLWAPEDERGEWMRVLATARDRRTVILDSRGAGELLFPGFGNPVSLFLIDGLMLPDDIQRKLQELSRAEVVVVPITISACSGVPDAPEFRDALKRFDLAWSGKHFEVFQLRSTTRNDGAGHVAGLL
jgi:hypothetical protein